MNLVHHVLAGYTGICIDCFRQGAQLPFKVGVEDVGKAFPQFRQTRKKRIHLVQGSTEAFIVMETTPEPGAEVIGSLRRAATGIYEMEKDTPEGHEGDGLSQVFGFFNTARGVKDYNLRPYEVELSVRLGPRDPFQFIQALFNHVHHLVTKGFQIQVLRGVYDPQSFSQYRIPQCISTPYSEVIVILGIIKSRAQETSPEMIIDAIRMYRKEVLSEFSKVVSSPAGGDSRKGAVLHSKKLSVSYRL
jgi:hypothetical protein